jgi:RNA polymerase sigma-70 factor (ECF subfamily)
VITTSTALEQWAGLADAELVKEVLAGRTALFELVMRRHNERLYRAARAIVLDEREAEDVVQQAYVNAYTHLGQFDGRAQFSTWLTRIAVHEALARARRRGRYTDLGSTDSGKVEQMMAWRSPPDPERQAFALASSRDSSSLRSIVSATAAARCSYCVRSRA